MSTRSQWGSRLGFILASAGSAIGLGSIWKFPYVTATQGGGAFLVIYLIICLTLGLVLMTTEMAIGRAGQSSPIGAFRKLGGKGWSIIGIVGVLVAFLILSFYSIVGGWTVAYVVKSISGEVATTVDSSVNSGIFTNFITDPIKPIVYHVIFGLLTTLTVIFGIQKGIERFSKYLMPLLFILMIILIIRGLTLDGAYEGLKFFLQPDFSKVNGRMLLEALGLAFFSLSLGIGIMVTYGSYISPNEDLRSGSSWVITLTLLTSILAGLMVLPAMKAFGFDAAAGPGLTFITMPAVFASMPVGQFFAILFFVLLLVAALTSSISILEVLVSFLVDEFEMKRVNAGILSFVLFIIVGITASLSMGIWSGAEYQIFGFGIFDALDKLTQNILMPLGEIFLAIFAAYFAWNSRIKQEIFGENVMLAGLFRFILGVVVPVVVGYIFLSGMGIV